MSAAAQTWTFDAAGTKYIDRTGIEHTITTGQAIKFTFTDTGVGGNFIGDPASAKVKCTDGFTFTISTDPRFTFISSADGTATIDDGEICFMEEPANTPVRWKIISLTIANADGVGTDNITTMTLEQCRDNSNTMVWAGIDTA